MTNFEKNKNKLGENNNRFSEKPLNTEVNDTTLDTLEGVEDILETDFSENEVNHIKKMNNILYDLKLKKGSMMDSLVLILKYKENHESFIYKNDIARKVVEHNLNKILKKLRIDIGRINFEMVKEYIEKNSKK